MRKKLLKQVWFMQLIPRDHSSYKKGWKRLFIHYMLSSCLSFISPLLFPFSFAVTFILFLILYEAMEYNSRKWTRAVKHFLVHSCNFDKNLMFYSLSFFFPFMQGMYKTTARDLEDGGVGFVRM